jgi:flagellar hook assembly protein FlgD
VQLYKNFQGLDGDGEELVDPSSGQVTKFMNSGDPITNTGWLGDYDRPPGDVSFMQGCGTFDLAPLDTQRVVYAIIVGHDNNRLSSVLDLRKNTHFVKNGFLNDFKLRVLADTKVNYASTEQANLEVKVYVEGNKTINSVQASIYNYENNFIYQFELFDDGQNNDEIAGDNIFGNFWQTNVSDEVLYLNLKVTDSQSKEWIYEFADYNITLSDSVVLNSIIVVDDHINNDGKINPGELIRLNLNLSNNYSAELKKVMISMETEDPFIKVEKSTMVFDNIAAKQNVIMLYDLNDENSYLSFTVSPDVPDTHTIDLTLNIIDEDFHSWEKYYQLKVEALNYQPNKIYAQNVAGMSAGYFVISVVNPFELTGHSYAITVSDSVDGRKEQGFNLVDQTIGTILLRNHELPDEYAFNIPITDGFKIVEAFLPEGEILKDFVSISGSTDVPFENCIIDVGSAKGLDFYKVELEFTNEIDDSLGAIGTPAGQSAFDYIFFPNSGTFGFFPCAFNVWKIFDGQRTNKLNVCFAEYAPAYPTHDSTWTPLEWMYIMSTDYDSSGLFYIDQNVNAKDDVLYKILFYMLPDKRVYPGDKYIFERVFPATSEDMWVFVPTNVKDGSNPKSTLFFALFQNYPNPFNPTTTIRFSINLPSLVHLKIFNIMGQEIVELVNTNLLAGDFQVMWDGKNKSGQLVSSGVYFARLKSEQKIKIIKMLLIR